MSFNYGITNIPRHHTEIKHLEVNLDTELQKEIINHLYVMATKDSDELISECKIANLDIFKQLFPRGGSILYYAIREHQQTLVNDIIQKFGNELLNVADKRGNTPLIAATTSWPEEYYHNRTYDLIKSLLIHGASPHGTKKRNPIKNLIKKKGSLPTIILLARHGCKFNWNKRTVTLPYGNSYKQMVGKYCVTDKEITVYLCLKTRNLICDVFRYMLHHLLLIIDEDLEDYFKKSDLHSYRPLKNM